MAVFDSVAASNADPAQSVFIEAQVTRVATCWMNTN